MDGFEIVAGLLTLAAIFSYLNHRFLGLPATIGLMAIGLAKVPLLRRLGLSRAEGEESAPHGGSQD